MLGHSSIKLTVDLYGRWLPMANKAAFDRLDDPTLTEVVADVVAGHERPASTERGSVFSRSSERRRRRHPPVIWHVVEGWAHLSAERLDQAAESARLAIGWNTAFADAHAIPASALGHASQPCQRLVSRRPKCYQADRRAICDVTMPEASRGPEESDIVTAHARREFSRQFMVAIGRHDRVSGRPVYVRA